MNTKDYLKYQEIYNKKKIYETTCPWWQLTDLEQEYYKQLFDKMDETGLNKVEPQVIDAVIGYEFKVLKSKGREW